MSTPPKGKLALPELAAMKQRGDKIVMVTAYDAPGARFAEDAGVEIILVGDTAAMVVLGYEGTTVPVTMDEMLFLTRTVARSARHPIVVGDMPFGSFQVSDEDDLDARVLGEPGAGGVVGGDHDDLLAALLHGEELGQGQLSLGRCAHFVSPSRTTLSIKRVFPTRTAAARTFCPSRSATST